MPECRFEKFRLNFMSLSRFLSILLTSILTPLFPICIMLWVDTIQPLCVTPTNRKLLRRAAIIISDQSLVIFTMMFEKYEWLLVWCFTRHDDTSAWNTDHRTTGWVRIWLLLALYESSRQITMDMDVFRRLPWVQIPINK